MYRYNLLSHLLLFGILLNVITLDLAAQEIDIMTYNIHHGADKNGQSSLDYIGDYIKGTQVPIVGLQEVDSVCIRSHKKDQPAELSRLTGLESHFTRHFPFEGGAYGQALLSKYPVTNLQNISLPILPLALGKRTSMLVSDILIAPEKEITVCVVHLDYRDRTSRLHQIDIIWEFLQSKNKNLILMGDMNANPDSPELKELLKHFERFQQEPEPNSYPAENPDRRIDFVLVRKGSALRIIKERVDNVPYSDHIPVITTVEYR